MMKLKDIYPLYLDNEAKQPNADLEVTDKYTGEVAFRCAQADAATIDAGIAGAVEAAEPMARLPSYERQAVLQHCVDRFKERYDELAYALCVEAGKPIKDSRRRGHPADRHLPHRRRGERADDRRGPAARHLAARQGLSGHLEARADRAVQLHLAVQLPAQPRRPQDRAGDRGRLPVRDEAGEPHAARRDHHGRGAGRDRSAQGRLLDPARASRGRRPVHHGRAAEAAQLHRLARRSAGT